MAERESDSVAQFRTSDKIVIRRTAPGEGDEPVVTEEPLMRLPQWENKFTGVEPAGILPKGLSVVDTTKMNPKEKNPHIIVGGDMVEGVHTIPLDEGKGAIPLRPGVEVFVDATRLTSKLGDARRLGASRPAQKRIQ